jgi:DNA-binding CsgD family transcriptional regulator
MARVSELRSGTARFWVVSFPLSKSPRLTEAEHEVALAAARGASNREIAAARGASVRTVANQIAAACRKLGVRNRRELVAVLARS